MQSDGSVTLNNNVDFARLLGVIRGGALDLADSNAGLHIDGAVSGGSVGNAAHITATGALAINANVTGNDVLLSGLGVTQQAGTLVDALAGTYHVPAGWVRPLAARGDCSQ